MPNRILNIHELLALQLAWFLCICYKTTVLWQTLLNLKICSDRKTLRVPFSSAPECCFISTNMQMGSWTYHVGHKNRNTLNHTNSMEARLKTCFDFLQKLRMALLLTHSYNICDLCPLPICSLQAYSLSWVSAFFIISFHWLNEQTKSWQAQDLRSLKYAILNTVLQTHWSLLDLPSECFQGDFSILQLLQCFLYKMQELKTEFHLIWINLNSEFWHKHFFSPLC